jgi:dynein heavy chain
VEDGAPLTFWLPGFFFPLAFLTGVLQNHARRHRVAVDGLSFGYEVDDRPVEVINRPPAVGCIVHGLVIEGAHWDRRKELLVEAPALGRDLAFPMVALKPEFERVPPTEGVYVCPCYKTMAREGELSSTGHSTSFVCSIELPSQDECKGSLTHATSPHFSPHWIKRGVALFLSTPD